LVSTEIRLALWGLSKVGEVVRALASHLGSVPVVGIWVEFVEGSLLAPRVFLQVLWFSSLHKNQHFQIPIQPGCHCLLMSPWLGRSGDYSLHYDVKFDLPFYQFNAFFRRYYLPMIKPQQQSNENPCKITEVEENIRF